jgi:NAD+ diphosphatase
MTLDRAGDGRRRDPDWLAAQRAHPAARALHAGTAGIVLDGDELRVAPLGGAPADVLLGLDAAGPLFAVDLDAPAPGGPEPPPPIGPGGQRGSGVQRPPSGANGERRRPPGDADGAVRPVGLREALAVLDPADAGLAAHAAALLNWHRRHPFCAVCGHASEIAEAGMVRVCPRCGAHHFPRTDPVVIMVVCDGDRVLLGRNQRWPPRRYSALAGFVEPGETLEEAVRREVAEEAGVEVGTPRYVASQPWPFPASLMVGFEADWTGGEPRRQDDELEDVRWFSRAEVAAAAALDADGWGREPETTGGGLLLPPRLAIARQLIDRWLAPPGYPAASAGSAIPSSRNV